MGRFNFNNHEVNRGNKSSDLDIINLVRHLKASLNQRAILIKLESLYIS